MRKVLEYFFLWPVTIFMVLIIGSIPVFFGWIFHDTFGIYGLIFAIWLITGCCGIFYFSAK